MNQYYLISQFPALDGVSDSSPIPISQEYFSELCSRFLGKKASDRLNNLSLIPKKDSKKTGSSVIDGWNESEKLLRIALAGIRASKISKSYDTQIKDFPPQMVSVCRAAVDIEDPLEAEQFLNRYRLGVLEELRPSDPFCEDYLFYYGLKLKLLSRIGLFDEAEGRKQYSNIYDSIINGDKQEA